MRAALAAVLLGRDGEPERRAAVARAREPVLADMVLRVVAHERHEVRAAVQDGVAPEERELGERDRPPVGREHDALARDPTDPTRPTRPTDRPTDRMTDRPTDRMTDTSRATDRVTRSFVSVTGDTLLTHAWRAPLDARLTRATTASRSTLSLPSTAC